MRSKFRALFYNIAVLAVMFLGASALWVAFSAIIGIAYMFFVLFMLYYFLRKHLCTNCTFYGKLCYTGWGWLASKLFLKGSGKFELGLRLAGVTWGVFLFLPVAAFITLKEWGYLLIWVCLGAFLMGDHFGHCVTCPIRETCVRLKKKMKKVMCVTLRSLSLRLAFFGTMAFLNWRKYEGKKRRKRELYYSKIVEIGSGRRE